MPANRLKLDRVASDEIPFRNSALKHYSYDEYGENVSMSAWIYIGFAAGAVIICVSVGYFVRKHACDREQTERASLPWIFLLYSAFSIVSMCCALTYGNKTDTEKKSAPSIDADLIAKFTSLKNFIVQIKSEELQICHNGCGLDPQEWQISALIQLPHQPIYSDLAVISRQTSYARTFIFSNSVVAYLSRRESFKFTDISIHLASTSNFNSPKVLSI